MWEFPGGKVRSDESLGAALSRELNEELRVALTRIGETLFVARDPGSSFDIHFVEAEIAGTPRAIEHEALTWARSEQVEALDLAPTDRRFAEQVLGDADSGTP